MTDGVTRAGDDLLVEVRLTPRADRDRIDGTVILSDGAVVLAMRVRAVPEDGKANQAATALLAAALGIAKSRVVLETGATQRRKRLRITGVDETLETRVRALFL